MVFLKVIMGCCDQPWTKRGNLLYLDNIVCRLDFDNQNFKNIFID